MEQSPEELEFRNAVTAIKSKLQAEQASLDGINFAKSKDGKIDIAKTYEGLKAFHLKLQKNLEAIVSLFGKEVTHAMGNLLASDLGVTPSLAENKSEKPVAKKKAVKAEKKAKPEKKAKKEKESIHTPHSENVESSEDDPFAGMEEG